MGLLIAWLATLWLLRQPINASPLETGAERRLERAASGVQWGPCSIDFQQLKTTNASIDCGNVTVPLDYADSSKGTIQLNLLRVHAFKGPAKGSVLLNYGGPGQPGRKLLVETIERASIVTGLVHDLVAFDPRGTARTIPMICYNNTETNGATQSSSNASDTATGEIWVGGANLAEACQIRNGTTGPYIGTATTARDLMSVVDALQEDGLLRFYGRALPRTSWLVSIAELKAGMSYGSILGATVAAMFPERMDKIYLDGIANSHEYFNSNRETEWLTDADQVWSDFFQACAAVGSPACALANDSTKSGAALEAEFYDWLFALKEEPVSMGPTSMLTYTAVKTFLFGQLYSPSTWHNVSWILGAAYERNATLLTDLLLAQPPPITASSGGQAEQGIRCSDKVPRMDSLQAFLPLVDELEATSTMVGDLVVQMQATCLQWKMPAVETYKGDFQTKTRNPILFVSNEFDPVTPLMSAQNMSAGFEGSRLLVNKGGHGHTTSQQMSLCILLHAASYFQNGTLPEPGVVCEPSATLFGNVTAGQVQQMALQALS